MRVDVQRSSGMGRWKWRAIRTHYWESNMKIKTNIRAGIGANRCGGIVVPRPRPLPVLA